MFGIMRTGRGFRMILNGNNGQCFMTHAFDTGVVEIDVRHFNFRRQAVRLHRKAVIMRSDFHVAVARIPDRLITAPVTKCEFESLAAKRASQQLMPKANSKGRYA